MKFFRILVLMLLPMVPSAQPKFEIQEFTGVVKSIEPGFRFALERLGVEVNGKTEYFLFYPDYGKLLTEKIKIGDQLSLKANVNLHVKELKKDLSESNRVLSWYLFQDRIDEIKIGNDWVPLPKPQAKDESREVKVFLDQKILDEYYERGIKSGLTFKNGVVAFNQGANKYFDPFKDVKKEDLVSFFGYKMPMKEGYQYPVDNVQEVFHFNPLSRASGQLHSYLFKQNYTCIGVKFMTADGKELSLSFPSDKAQMVKNFLEPEKELRIYYGRDYLEQKYTLPELRAIIQGSDTLRIEEFSFYGGADGKHEHRDVELKGKITRINRTEKGNVSSIIVGSTFYVEIDAMMAQQLGTFFKKGEDVVIFGKERIKKVGEIYQKNYEILVPEKIVVKGKQFSVFVP